MVWLWIIGIVIAVLVGFSVYTYKEASMAGDGGLGGFLFASLLMIIAIILTISWIVLLILHLKHS